MQEHAFTSQILAILEADFGQFATTLFAQSTLLNYLNIKTRSASRGSKARASFANHYALYVLVEDYVRKGFVEKGDYQHYDGAKFNDLLRCQRELPFAEKLQNHALNHHLNEEYKKYFPTSPHVPIIRNVETNRYWINTHLLIIEINGTTFNIARNILKIIEAYISAKREAFEQFIANITQIQQIETQSPKRAILFIENLLHPQIDACIFEIVSYAILKIYYGSQSIYWGWHIHHIRQDSLVLCKTGRTNANDGGIDFVMKPLGRFFQVTETTNVKKYFMDIDKIEKYPLTFVIKSQKSIEDLRQQIEEQAKKIYPISSLIHKYMSAIEEIINILILLERLAECIKQDKLHLILQEIILQSRIEFNIPLE
jgi:hypothetical protein